jgi:hypothetical protein
MYNLIIKQTNKNQIISVLFLQNNKKGRRTSPYLRNINKS